MSNDDVRHVARIKGEADQQMFRKIEFGMAAGRAVWGVSALFVVAVVWVVHLSSQVAANSSYIEREGKEPGMFQRMHDTEEQGKRRDNQIRALWKHDFGEDPY